MLQRNKWVYVLITVAVSFLIFNTSIVIAHSDHNGGHNHCKHCEEKLSAIDTDNDGKISRREFMQYHGQLFNKHDLNDDRFLDMDEIHWMMEDMHEKMRAKHGHSDDHGKGHHGKHGHDNDGDIEEHSSHSGHDDHEHEKHDHEDDQEENDDQDDEDDSESDDSDAY